MMKDNNPQIQKTKRTSSTTYNKKSPPRHCLIKLQNTKMKRRSESESEGEREYDYFQRSKSGRWLPITTKEKQENRRMRYWGNITLKHLINAMIWIEEVWVQSPCLKPQCYYVFISAKGKQTWNILMKERKMMTNIIGCKTLTLHLSSLLQN